MSLQDVVRWFLPREDHFFTFLERQASSARRGAEAFAKFVPGVEIEGVQKEVQTLEHEGDKASHELEEALQKTFVTPIDREDLQRLSAEFDDILDLTNNAARACALFGVHSPTPPMVELMGILVAATTDLEGAVPLLRKHEYATIIQACRGVRQHEKKADGVYRQALSALFRDDAKSAKDLLREKEVLDHLEAAIDHCEQVAHSLTNLAVKHG